MLDRINLIEHVLPRHPSGVLNKIFDAILRRWRADGRRVEGLRFDSLLTSRVRAQERTQLEPKPNRLDLGERRHAVAGNLVALAVADDNDAVGRQAERALDRQEHPRSGATEVAVEDVAVVRVHDQGYAAEAGGQSADGAGLGHVGVDNVRPDLANDLDQPGQRDQVVEGTDFAPERCQ